MSQTTDSFAALAPDAPQGPVPSPGVSLTMSSVLTVLTHIVVKLGIVPDGESIDAHVPLLEGGLGLDSIAVLELVSAIENRFQITLPVEDLNTERFANLAAVARLVITTAQDGGRA
jgi:acyl carrier protein